MPEKRKILIVDDEPVITDTLVTILGQAGYRARGAYTGAEALRIGRELQPDVLIADVILPDVNGIDIAIIFHKELPGCRVLLFSGQAATADLLADARGRGYDFDILAKPVHPEELLRRLEEPGAMSSAATPVAG